MNKFQVCVCGESEFKPWIESAGIPIVICSSCGIRRVKSVDPDASLKLYDSGEYHETGSVDTPEESAKRGSHNERLLHDLEVAKLRVQKLFKHTPELGMLIDVGCANGAFMQIAKDNGFREVIGVDLSNKAVGESLRAFVKVGDLRHLGFQRRTADVVTFNDSFEHFIDPLSALKAAKGILKRSGVLVIEVPDMGCAAAKEQGAAFVHVKPHEHLWYFTPNQLRELLEVNGFNVIGIDVPIPGKITLYACPQVTVEEVEVHGPAGIGDVIWTMNKLKTIRDREEPCKLTYVVCCDAEVKIITRGKDFLLLSDLIDNVEFRPLPLPADTGCDDPSLPIFRLLANDYLDSKKAPWKGNLIENWHPELGPTNFDIGVRTPAAALDQAQKRLGVFAAKYIAVYMSSHVWNSCTLQPHWTSSDWAKLIIEIADTGYKPVILGAGWDADFARDVAIEIVTLGRDPAKVWLNLVGRTPITLAMAYMELADAVIGIAAGLPIISAYLGWKTAIMWPVRGVSNVDVCRIQPSGYCSFAPEFPTNWMDPKVLATGSYAVLQVGAFDVQKAAQTVLDLASL